MKRDEAGTELDDSPLMVFPIVINTVVQAAVG